MIGHKMATFRGSRLAALLALATMLAGCGGSKPSGETSVSPELGKRHREMEGFMKDNKQTAAPSKKARNHP